MNPIKSLILDMDGVLWRSQEPIGDLPAIFRTIAEKGRKVLMATNNATRTPAQYVERMRSFGVEIESWQVIHSGEATALHLKSLYPQGCPVFLVGEEGIRLALTEQGFWLAQEKAAVVVSSMDRQITYEKLRQATLLVRSGARFLATNADRTFPTPDGLIPGAGAILAALEAATDVKAQVIGKPGNSMYQAALQRLGTTAAETLVVGDRIETDIVGAQEMGCRTALVLSGVTSAATAHAFRPAPDIIAPDLATVVEGLARL